MIIAFPIGGIGLRFREAGYNVPKPLLEVGGKFLLQHALASLTLLQGQYEFVLRNEIVYHPLYPRLGLPGCLHVITEPTNGPIQTLMRAKDCLMKDEELLIMDCDSFLNPQELADAIADFRLSNANGGVTTRETTDPNCSFVSVKDHWVITAQEKVPFTTTSSTGPYWFKSSKLFFYNAIHALQDHHTSIAPIYNYLLRVRAYPVTSFRHLGTPEEFEAFKQQCSVSAS